MLFLGQVLPFLQHHGCGWCWGVCPVCVGIPAIIPCQPKGIKLGQQGGVPEVLKAGLQALPLPKVPKVLLCTVIPDINSVGLNGVGKARSHRRVLKGLTPCISLLYEKCAFLEILRKHSLQGKLLLGLGPAEGTGLVLHKAANHTPMGHYITHGAELQALKAPHSGLPYGSSWPTAQGTPPNCLGEP